jgi:hypothetical protein
VKPGGLSDRFSGRPECLAGQGVLQASEGGRPEG